MKNRIFLLILFLALSQNLYAMQVEAENISSDKYFSTTLNEINSAKSQVFVVMYLVSVLPDQPDSQPNQLVSALIAAKLRGVDVKVILDQNINFESESMDDAVVSNKNQKAYELLTKNGIPTFFDTSDTYTHAKAIVIDNETVILGSTNWSKAALTKNNEADVIVRSKDLAESLTSQFDKIKLQEYIPAVVTPSVRIPRLFLTKKDTLGEMVSQSDERTLDVYLYLLGQYDQNKDSKVDLNYDNLAQSLSINTMTKEDYRRQITKVLLKLKDKYNLIDFENAARGQNAQIILKDVKNPKKNYDPKTDSFDLPTAYWKYLWNQKLNFSAKAMYLIVLSNTSPSAPNFALSRSDLSKEYSISESFISDGTKGLRISNLLDIQYSSLEDQNYSDRQSNVYTPKPIYDPAELQKELAVLRQKEGTDKLQRAINTASIVFAQNDLNAIKELISLENQYGQTIIQQAAKKISDKSPDNPKRCIGYLISTIKSMANPKGGPE